ncbi:hypothetical protein VPH35_035848 [Triticum aestivum]|uniref:Uncharacterized protein n=1 Tax=Aegilops tauschii subsp. strangulata TaxID=200361 RepID=A0A453B2U4_AEGTS
MAASDGAGAHLGRAPSQDFTTVMDKRRLKLGKTTMSGADRDPKCREARFIFLELLYCSWCYFVMSNCVFFQLPFLIYELVYGGMGIQRIKFMAVRRSSVRRHMSRGFTI